MLNKKIQNNYVKKGLWANIKLSTAFGPFIALVIIFIVMSFSSKYFLTVENLFNILKNTSTIGIIGIGMTFVIISQGFDLSVGSVLAAASMLTARFMFLGMNPYLAFIIGLTLGTLLGFINGILITKVRVNPFVTTLGMLSIGRGLTYWFSSGIKGAVSANIPFAHKVLSFLGSGYIGFVPFPVIELAILVIIFSYLGKNTVLGRQIYAVGSNIEAAKLSGVNVDKVRIYVYALTGLFAAFAGILRTGLLQTASTNAGVGLELDVIAAVILGGTSLKGGEGTIIGTMIGAVIMAIIRNSFVLLHIPAFGQTITIGLVIIAAVALDQIRNRVKIAN